MGVLFILLLHTWMTNIDYKISQIGYLCIMLEYTMRALVFDNYQTCRVPLRTLVKRGPGGL